MSPPPSAEDVLPTLPWGSAPAVPPGAGKGCTGCGSLVGSIRSVGPEGHLLPVADPIRKLKRREPEKIIIPSPSELFF